MARVNYTKILAEEYTRLYKTCEAKASQFAMIDKLVGQLISNRSCYEMLLMT